MANTRQNNRTQAKTDKITARRNATHDAWEAARLKTHARELAQITNTIVDYLSKMNQSVLTNIIYDLRVNNMSYAKRLYSYFPTIFTKSNLDIALDTFNIESQPNETPVITQLLSQLIKRALGSRTEKKLNGDDLITLQKLLHEKIKFTIAQNNAVKLPEISNTLAAVEKPLTDTPSSIVKIPDSDILTNMSLFKKTPNNHPIWQQARLANTIPSKDNTKKSDTWISSIKQPRPGM